MTTRTASTIVAVTGGVMAAYVLLGRQGKGQPGSTYKALWAVGALTLGLSVVADLAPELAGWFAVLVLLGAYWRQSRGGQRPSPLGQVFPGAPKDRYPQERGIPT